VTTAFTLDVVETSVIAGHDLSFGSEVTRHRATSAPYRFDVLIPTSSHSLVGGPIDCVLTWGRASDVQCDVMGVWL